MSDEHEFQTVHSLKEAAELLGTAIDTARMMCLDGRLQGTQDERGRWTILVPTDPETVRLRKRRPNAAITHPAIEDPRDQEIAVLRAEKDLLQHEVTFLRDELGSRRVEGQQLLQQFAAIQQQWLDAQQQLALPPPPPTRPPWWRRFLGLD